MVQAGTATSVRTREEEQSFNILEVEAGSVTLGLKRWTGAAFESAGADPLRQGGGAWKRARGAGRPGRGLSGGPAGSMSDSMINGFDLDDFVTRTLAEDMGEGGDVTSAATIPADARFTATMNCREEIVVAGIDIAAAFFRRARSRTSR